jgi:hypothetical protein
MQAPFRHAAYYAPAPQSLEWDLGSQWLGRCAHQLQTLEPPRWNELNAELFEKLTLSPRLYGWHATLKAPFELNPGFMSEDVQKAFQELARNTVSSFHLPIKLTELGDFLALVPSHPSLELQKLAEDCVTQLHSLALPLSKSELQRRSGSGLNDRQTNLLHEWGYPFVMDQFKFHMTLSGSLKNVDPQLKIDLKAAAQEWFAPILKNGLSIDAVTWFSQDQPNSNFQWLERFKLDSRL